MARSNLTGLLSIIWSYEGKAYQNKEFYMVLWTSSYNVRQEESMGDDGKPIAEREKNKKKIRTRHRLHM